MKKVFLIQISTVLLLFLCLCTTVTANTDLLPVDTLNLSTIADCPDNIDQWYPSRVVLQYIDGHVYKWEEYDLDNEGAFCIFLQKPMRKRLLAYEARILLDDSSNFRNVLMSGEPLLQSSFDSSGSIKDLQNSSTPTLSEFDKPFLPGYPKRETPFPEISEESPLLTIQNVIGADNRERIGSTDIYPWNLIGYISTRTPSGFKSRGSGVIVTPYMVLTAGHIIFNQEEGYVENLNFSPGQKQDIEGAGITAPYGQFAAAVLYTNSVYADSNGSNPEYDYGVALFNKSFASVGITTYMPIVFNIKTDFVNLAGYPKEVQYETDSKTLWRSSGEAFEISDRAIGFDADISGGNSGGPIWQFLSSPNRRRLIAIVSSSVQSPSGNYNAGCRLVSQNQDLIESWMDWEPKDNWDENDWAPMNYDSGEDINYSGNESISVDDGNGNLSVDDGNGNHGLCFITVLSQTSKF